MLRLPAKIAMPYSPSSSSAVCSCLAFAIAFVTKLGNTQW